MNPIALEGGHVAPAGAGADLAGANLTSAFLNGTNLAGADLSFANLFNANLSGARLINAVGLGSSPHAARYDINTDFTGTGFDPVAAGWTLVPEPSTALLLGLGLTGLAGTGPKRLSRVGSW